MGDITVWTAGGSDLVRSIGLFFSTSRGNDMTPAC